MCICGYAFDFLPAHNRFFMGNSLAFILKRGFAEYVPLIFLVFFFFLNGFSSDLGFIVGCNGFFW